MKDNKIEPETIIHRQVADAREGTSPRGHAAVLRVGVVWPTAVRKGYPLLLPDLVVPSLNALGAKERTQFLLDMTRLGDALRKVAGAVRINYAMFGSVEPALHAHVIPRYLDEPEDKRTALAVGLRLGCRPGVRSQGHGGIRGRPASRARAAWV